MDAGMAGFTVLLAFVWQIEIQIVHLLFN